MVTEDRATGKDFEAHRYRLFVSLERCINSALDSLKRLKLKSTARKAESVAKTNAGRSDRQLVLEFVNAALHGSSAVVFAPDFQS
jgi:hypothetical protein